MINMIRADVYRILRGKALYVIFLLLTVLSVALVVSTMSAGNINIGVEWNMWDDMGIADMAVAFNGLSSAAILYTQLDNLVFFLLPLVYAVIMPMFIYSTVKNEVTWGMSRAKIYMSKLGLSFVLCIVMVVFYMIVGMLLATILRGFGGPAPAGYWQQLFMTLGAQLFIMLAVTCLAVFLMFALRHGGAVNVVYIAYFFVPTMVIMVLYQVVNPRFIRLLDFLLMFAVNRLGFLSQLSMGEILTAFGVGAAHILLCTVGGIALFKRAEIK
ncbi:MAG: hypothetical protein FWC92_08005 [Defluviitaleaceae bacterium]|nr:hypothetical protein [Defluviitaleaceae bacterium]